MKRLTMTAAALALLTTTPARAEVNQCQGVIHAGQKFTLVIDDSDYKPNGCRFETASPLGRRILAACPNGTRCWIDVVSEQKLVDKAAIRKGCPDQKAKCLARDNPKSSPELYRVLKSITIVEQVK